MAFYAISCDRSRCSRFSQAAGAARQLSRLPPRLAAISIPKGLGLAGCHLHPQGAWAGAVLGCWLWDSSWEPRLLTG